MRKYSRYVAIGLVLILAFALRAVTPAGYMPGGPGSGLLFELCPDQLPAGVSLPGSASAHHQHHHGADPDTSPPDHCRIGHLLVSLINADADPQFDALPAPPVFFTKPASRSRLSQASTVFRSRAPPLPVTDPH